MYKYFILTILIFAKVSLFVYSLHANDRVGEVWRSSDAALPEARVAYIDPNKGVIYEVDLNGHISWKYKIPNEIVDRGRLRRGADIEWIEGADHFLFIIPQGGIYEVNRQKEIVWSYQTKYVSHDADRLPNGNTIFVNAWDSKGDNQVVEITPEGKVVFDWKISDSEVSCDHSSADCNRQHGNKSEYTHVNGIQKFKDGKFLVSLRNLNKVVLVDKNLRVIERHRRIRNVHDPRLDGDKLVAIARRKGLITRKRGLITTKEDSVYNFKYRDMNYAFLRTNERISNDKILLTDTAHLLIFNSDTEKIIWKLRLDGFGNQRKNKDLPFIYKAAWVGSKAN